MAVGRNEFARLAGLGCDGGEPLIARFLFGLANAREARDAQLHLASCPRCKALGRRIPPFPRALTASTAARRRRLKRARRPDYREQRQGP
jgi:hypothetical protein